MTDSRVEAVAQAIKARTPSKRMAMCRIEAEDFLVMADALQAFVIADALRTFDQTRDESEVMPHTGTHGSPELDEDAAKLVTLGADPGPTFATAPAMGADPPWLKRLAKEIRDEHFGNLSTFCVETIIKKALAFANAQPPSEAEVEIGASELADIVCDCGEPLSLFARKSYAKGVLIAAARVRSGR